MENKFSPVDIKMLKVFNRYLDTPNNTNYKKSLPTLLDKLGISRENARKYFILWNSNFREDGNYELIEDPNLSLNPIYDIIEKLSEGLIDEDEIDEKILGDFSFCSNSYRESLPCITVDKSDVIIKVESDVWEENSNLSGLDEDSRYYYNIAHSSYGGHTELDSEEFNYLYYDDETIKHVINICLLTGNHQYIHELESNNRMDSEELSSIIQEILLKNDLNDVIHNYLRQLEYELDIVRSKEVKKEYDMEIKYPPYFYGNSVSLTIPTNEFLDLLTSTSEIITSFDDILKLEFNPYISLGESWYETYVDDAGSESVINELNSVLEKIVDKYNEDDDLKSYFENIKEFNYLKDKLGFKLVDSYGRNTGGKFELTTNNNQKLYFLMKDVNFNDNKITIYYNKEKHIIPIDDLSNWATGSVLNLETIIKKHLNMLL
jgi:hypothetical protein